MQLPVWEHCGTLAWELAQECSCTPVWERCGTPAQELALGCSCTPGGKPAWEPNDKNFNCEMQTPNFAKMKLNLSHLKFEASLKKTSAVARISADESEIINQELFFQLGTFFNQELFSIRNFFQLGTFFNQEHVCNQELFSNQ